MPPLVRIINSKDLKVGNFAPIKGVPNDKINQLIIKG